MYRRTLFTIYLFLWYGICVVVTLLYPCAVDVHLSPYSKLLLASREQVLGLVAEEKAALQGQLTQGEDATACFIQSALCNLQVTLTN